MLSLLLRRTDAFQNWKSEPCRISWDNSSYPWVLPFTIYVKYKRWQDLPVFFFFLFKFSCHFMVQSTILKICRRNNWFILSRKAEILRE